MNLWRRLCVRMVMRMLVCMIVWVSRFIKIEIEGRRNKKVN